MPEEKLTLSNLRLSPSGELSLKSFNKEQRKALYDLCTVYVLTWYDESARKNAQEVRDLIRKNTLTQNNVCEFDKTDDDRKREEWNRRLSLVRPK